MMQLVQKKHLKLAAVRHFVLDECDKMLESVGKHHRIVLSKCWTLLHIVMQNVFLRILTYSYHA